MKFCCLILLILLASANSFAEGVTVQSLSQGACWFEESEVLKISSFNDRESISLDRESIGFQIEGLLKFKNRVALVSNALALHCGGYGASLIVKADIDDRSACLWLMIENGKLAIRSFGGLEETSKGSEQCDGYKWGELILGLRSPDQKKVLESAFFQHMIQKVETVSGNAMKVTLSPDFHGKELMVMEELKKQIDLRYIELNLFQHPVGEVSALK